MNSMRHMGHRRLYYDQFTWVKQHRVTNWRRGGCLDWTHCVILMNVAPPFVSSSPHRRLYYNQFTWVKQQRVTNWRRGGCLNWTHCVILINVAPPFVSSSPHHPLVPNSIISLDITNTESITFSDMGWLRLVGSINYRCLVQKSLIKETILCKGDIYLNRSSWP